MTERIEYTTTVNPPAGYTRLGVQINIPEDVNARLERACLRETLLRGGSTRVSRRMVVAEALSTWLATVEPRHEATFGGNPNPSTSPVSTNP